jgi:hypothetical protein
VKSASWLRRPNLQISATLVISGSRALGEMIAKSYRGGRPRSTGRGTVLRVAVEDDLLVMTEYSAAKSAGEMVYAALNRSECIIRVLVSRLPRLLTDQTATVDLVKNADPLEVMLPIVSNV